MQEEEELQLTTVGVDIGSSTSHLVFSRLQLTLEGSRYRVTKREVLNESEILLTPYVDDTRIDVEALEAFINQQYKNAKIRRDEVDTGALILQAWPSGDATRAIAELFARGRKICRGERRRGLEATMAAHGSARRHSASRWDRLNIDIGGGPASWLSATTVKFRKCRPSTSARAWWLLIKTELSSGSKRPDASTPHGQASTLRSVRSFPKMLYAR
jgi:ethanolamine utilization protein EutA